MKTDQMQVPPHSLEAEMSVLGAMLIEKEALEYGLENLVADSFYNLDHKLIFSAMADLHDEGIVVDIQTVSDRVKISAPQNSKTNFPALLTECMQIVPTAAHVDSYVRLTKEKEILRNMISVSQIIAKDAYDQQEEVSSLIDRAERMVFAISDRNTTKVVYPAADVIADAIDRLDALHAKTSDVTGISTGFSRFDQMTTGLQPGNLMILAARPGMGKTALALDIVRHVAIESKIPTIFYSFEMSDGEIMNRMVSAMGDIHLQRLRTGSLKSEQEWQTMHHQFDRIADSPLYLMHSSAAVNILTIRSSARRTASQLKAKGQALGLIVVDYLQLMQGSKRNSENRQAEISEISRGLKALALDLKIPVIALSQLSRQAEGHGQHAAGRPQLWHLRESGALEQDADIVAFNYREAANNEQAAEEAARKAILIVAKHRNGPLGDVHLEFVKEMTRFVQPVNAPAQLPLGQF